MSKISLLFFIAVVLACTALEQNGACHNGEENMHNEPAEMSALSLANSEGLAAGVWGGDHIRMEVTGGGAEISYDCAHSTIDQPIVPDSDGNFNVKGKFTREHGGPIRRDEEIKSRPVRYTGRVRDKVMTLTVTLADPEETAGTFTLTQGSVGRVMKCR